MEATDYCSDQVVDVCMVRPT